MAYSPPPPGKTEMGKPTPGDVPKQSVEIKDLPPEVRRNFLLSMVFFPSMVGGAICLVLFLGWWLLRDAKTPAQFAAELQHGIGSSTKRSRWQTARELAENIQRPELNTDPAILNALLDIVESPDLDEEVEVWSPSDMVRQDDEKKTRLRWFAAYMAGHMAGIQKSDRGLAVLTGALNEYSNDVDQDSAGLRYYASVGLGLMKDLRAADALLAHLESDPDAGVRASCAKALGTIGFHHFSAQAAEPGQTAVLEQIRAGLIKAYKTDANLDVTWNTAIALARVKDPAGRATLDKLAAHEDAVIQSNARRALDILDDKQTK